MSVALGQQMKHCGSKVRMGVGGRVSLFPDGCRGRSPADSHPWFSCGLVSILVFWVVMV